MLYLYVEGNHRDFSERGVTAPHTHRASRFLLDLQVVPAAQELTHLPVVVDPLMQLSGDHGFLHTAGIAAGADGIMLRSILTLSCRC